MKKIINIIMASALVVGFSACSDDTDNPYDHEATLSVVSSSLDFTATAGSGEVVVNSTDGDISTKLSSSWATASVSGSTVNVNVTENEAAEGRSAILTIYNNSDSVNVTVHQQGLIFRLDVSSITVGDEDSTYVYEVTTNVSPTITTSADWISASLSDGEFSVTTSANSTGHLRNGYIYYTAGSTTDSIKVTQYSLENDILGSGWYLYGLGTDGEATALSATIEQTDSGLNVTLPDLDMIIPVTLDADNASLTFYGGQRMGTFDYSGTTLYIYTCLWDTSAGYITWSTACGMVGSFEYDDEDQMTILEFEDDGSWGSYQATALRFEAFLTDVASSSNGNRLGSIFAIIGPTLLKP